LTVKQVYYRWEPATQLSDQQQGYLGEVREILQVAQDFLAGRLEYTDIHAKLINVFWYFDHFFVSYDLACLHNAAIYVLSVILYGIDFIKYNTSLEELINNYSDDFAFEAVTAYTIIDRNPPGAVFNKEENIIPIEFDFQKRLEFWQWWLTEAIPQAWELAQQSFS
jgi:hypothetical protein